MKFEDWFKTHDWWHESSAEERLRDEWNALAEAGLEPIQIATVIDGIIDVMRNEYGE